jgi:DNA-binding ferritin-like protein
VDDEAAEGFLTDLLDKHGKMAWMLRAHLEGE